VKGRHPPGLRLARIAVLAAVLAIGLIPLAGRAQTTPLTSFWDTGPASTPLTALPACTSGGMAVIDTTDPAAVRQVGFYSAYRA
jgi:hypothetical protein